MIWLWGVAGGFIGVWLANSRELLGFALGAAVLALVGWVRALRRRLDAAAQRLDAITAPSLAQLVAGPSPVVPERKPVPEAAAPVAAEPSPVMAERVRERAAEVQVSAPASAPERPLPPPPLPPRPAPEPVRPAAAAEPDVFDRGLLAIKRWFTEGNVPVKIGILVLFAGVAAALRFAAAEGYFTLPIGLRLSLIAAASLAGLALGWRERSRRAAFGLSLQGGAIGVLLLTVFAAFRWYGLLPSGLSFAMVVVLVAGAALLAVLQRSMALAVLGFLGGYLAPVLLSTGGGSHVALFSYYAVLNAAVFGISWRQNWRLLNLIGFFFTFAVGIAWGLRGYRSELFWTVEPFLILFFVFYVVIGLLYVTRQTDQRRPFLDGTLVFGTPLVAFPLQSALLHDQPMALAFSAVAVAGIYAALVWWLRERRQERLLTEAYAALALGFVTLAMPLAFSAGTTASLWALEGAAVAWMGLRQERRFPWLSGLALQLLAAGSYAISEFDHYRSADYLVLNSTWLGAAMLGFSGMALALIHDRFKPVRGLPAVLMVWGLLWWTGAGLTQLDDASRLLGGRAAEVGFGLLYLAASVVLAGGLRRYLAWPRLGWGMALWSGLLLLSAFWVDDRMGHVLASSVAPVWLVAGLAWLAALWFNRDGDGRSVALAHGAGLWAVVVVATLQIEDQLQVAEGWRFVALMAPLWLLSLGLWRRPQWLAWPRAESFQHDYSALWFGPALLILAVAWLVGLFQAGAAEPLDYLPVLNPLELGLIAMALLLWGYCRDNVPQVARSLPLWGLAAFAWVTLATLRAVHHGHGDGWSMAILQSGFAQACLTVVWSLIGVAALVSGSRLRRRPLWLAGGGLMAVVLAKLVLVDRQYMGDMNGIVSFLAVGLLLVGVGYFAPSPPKNEE